MEKGIIFDIQNLSLHDGPGLRTTVFFKGCPLKCLWCANPESQSIKKEIMVDHDKCVQCKACEKVCPTQAVTTQKGCIGCGKCVEVCLSKARKLVGREMSVEDVMKEILKDKVLYDHSNGGITLSGGEVLMQPKFALEILKRCKEEGIHTVLDSTVYCQLDTFKEILEYVDLVYADLKCIFDEPHKKLTFVSNQTILNNIRYMDDIQQEFNIRMPIIPGYNNTDEMMKETIQFLSSLKTKPVVWLLPFHAYGKSKYEKLNKEWPMGNLANMNRSELEPIAKQFSEAGINVQIQ